MKSKSHRSIRISGILAAVLFVVCFTTACQPTPDQEFVQSKNENELNSLINQPNSQVMSDIPANISDIVQSNDLTINIDAKVSIPKETTYPVVYAEPIVIIQEKADLILDVLIGDSPLISLRAQDATTILSKEQIINKIAELRIMLQDEGIKKDEYQTESINQEITVLKEQLETAPETVEIPYVDRKFARPVAGDTGSINVSEQELAAMSEEQRKSVEMDIEQSQQAQESNCEIIEGATDLGKSMLSTISICKKDNPIYSYVYFINQDKENSIINDPEHYTEITINDHVGGIQISAKDGYDFALDTLSNMGITGMELVRIASVPLVDPQNSFDTFNSCYKFIFSRPVSGIPTTYALEDGLATDNDRMAEVWKQEYIEIFVGDSGILKFNWDAPTQLGEPINDNVALKSFKEVFSIFKQQIINRCVFTDEVGVIERQIHIDEITLGMMKIKQQDTNKYIYVPVWDFFGYSLNTYDDTSQYVLDESGQKIIDKLGHSFLTINAIDGSIIDRSLGY